MDFCNRLAVGEMTGSFTSFPRCARLVRFIPNCGCDGAAPRTVEACQKLPSARTSYFHRHKRNDGSASGLARIPGNATIADPAPRGRLSDAFVDRRGHTMNRRTTLALTAMGLLCSGAAISVGQAQKSDTDKIKETLNGFLEALEALDIHKMEDFWAHDARATFIGPRDKTITTGWDAVRKKLEGEIAFWSELKHTTQEGPYRSEWGNCLGAKHCTQSRQT